MQQVGADRAALADLNLAFAIRCRGHRIAVDLWLSSRQCPSMWCAFLYVPSVAQVEPRRPIIQGGIPHLLAVVRELATMNSNRPCVACPFGGLNIT